MELRSGLYDEEQVEGPGREAEGLPFVPGLLYPEGEAYHPVRLVFLFLVCLR